MLLEKQKSNPVETKQEIVITFIHSVSQFVVSIKKEVNKVETIRSPIYALFLLKQHYRIYF